VNKSDVIKHVATTPKYINYCKRVAFNEYEDLFHFIILELDKKTEDFLVQKYKDGSLGKYYAGMVYNNYNSTSSPYYKSYKKDVERQWRFPNMDFNKDSIVSWQASVTDESVKEVNYSFIEKEIEEYKKESEQNKYTVDLFNVYLDCKTFREVEKRTGIYFVTAQKTIQKFKKEIKSRCQKYLQ
jgi:hypothetical protein